ncbi:hypothetical protein SMGD1_0515 [Sulfurimonas gotlandica GD1]|uniref:Uncharacterized protein n=1 Tax=Sulfurimonas gotlandica (strain DSM 19862 / JCM 16533 / GD1) TaxID=929558 RepID=H1FVB6_SULGG|nr:hypothetical protein [Sulfurimonas gotlandica]EHP29042.1 hypothetical protein SMGD1_0515 [Sulfurimonas gotlandica GD1]
MVVSNDAGATEYISHLMLNEKEYEWNVYALEDSIASKIFKKYDIEFDSIFNLSELNNIVSKIQPNVIFYGTGWQVDFSNIVKNICMNTKIKSVALIDHWSNYKERFAKESLPDTIIVMDDLANKIAKKTFNNKVNIIQLKNHFIEYMISNFSLIEHKSLDSIVFLSQPTVVNKVDLDAYEYTLVETLLNFFDNIIIRLHPSENENKFNKIIAKYPKVIVKIVKPHEEDLLITLSQSKLTIGLSSMALYISCLLNIDTVSCVLNSGIKPNIPIPKKYVIKNLNDLKDIVFSHSNINHQSENEIEFKNMIQHTLGDS